MCMIPHCLYLPISMLIHSTGGTGTCPCGPCSSALFSHSHVCFSLIHVFMLFYCCFASFVFMCLCGAFVVTVLSPPTEAWRVLLFTPTTQLSHTSTSCTVRTWHSITLFQLLFGMFFYCPFCSPSSCFSLAATLHPNNRAFNHTLTVTLTHMHTQGRPMSAHEQAMWGKC